jgi:hypothetical protein
MEILFICKYLKPIDYCQFPVSCPSVSLPASITALSAAVQKEERG